MKKRSKAISKAAQSRTNPPRRAKRPHAGGPQAASVEQEAREAENAAQAAAAARALAIEDGTDEDLLEEAAEDADNDDLPDVALAPGLVAALADAGVKTKEDWDALPLVRLKWPRSCGVPPEGADVEIVDDDPPPTTEPQAALLDKRIKALLRQQGMTLEEWRRLATEEGNDPRVLQALNERGAALAELGRAIATSDLCFTVEAFAARRREIAAKWNASVSFSKTTYRHCEWCAGRVLFRHRQSHFCSKECKQAAKDADPVRRQRRKERRARVDE